MSGQGCSPLLSLVRQCCIHNKSQAKSWRSFSSALVASSSRWAVLASRGVLQAEGPQALEFLQGMVSNDVRPLMGASGGPQQTPIYAAILTPKGKYLHDVFIYPHPERQEAILIDVDVNGKAAALQLLNRYKLRRPIQFLDVSSDYCVAAAWGSSSPPPGSYWRPDPRLPSLGFRALVPVSSVSSAVAGQGAAAGSEDEYRGLRYRLGVAEGETEIPSGQAAPLEYNVDELHGVSYTKGCYVGQERNSFTHYRGLIRRRLMPVRLEAVGPADTRAGASPGSSSVASAAVAVASGGGDGGENTGSAKATPFDILSGADIVDAASGRSIGQLRGAVLPTGPEASPGAVHASWGIAHMKLDAALSAAEGRTELMLASAPSSGTVSSNPNRAADVDKGRGQGRRGLLAGPESRSESGSETTEGQGCIGTPARGPMLWRVVPVRPVWWPVEWGHEEELASGGTGSKLS